MMHVRSTLSLTLFISLLVCLTPSCKKDEKTEEQKAAENFTDQLMGKWVSNCVPNKDGEFFRSYLTISSATRSVGDSYSYSDSSCRNKINRPGSTDTVESSYVVVGPSAAVLNAFEVNSINGANKKEFYSILAIVGEKLLFGDCDSSTCLTPATRSIRLLDDFYYTRDR